MVNSLSTFLRTALLSSIISVTWGNEYEALHFVRDRIPRLTFDPAMMKEMKHPQLMYPSTTACSAESNEESKFNTEQSFGKNSLFVRNTYEADQTLYDVDYNICKNSYQLSVLYHTSMVDFEFGLEVYFDKSEHKDKGFLESNRGDYDLIINTHAYRNYIKAFTSYIPGFSLLYRLPSLPVVSRFLQSPLYLDGDHKKEMGFIWINSFRMKYNFKAKRVAQSTYGLSVATRGLHECDNYNLGKEFFAGQDIDKLYGKDNQERMLKGVKLPPPNDDDKYKEAECESENQCFIKWSIVPAQLFHHLAVKPISCSDLLTVPVWKSTIYETLNKLDNFLFAFSMVLGHPIGEIIIHSGVHGVLQFPTGGYVWSMKPITLAENGIQVPDVIYKLVKLKVQVCDIPKVIVDKYFKPISPKMKPTDIENETDESKVSKNEPVDQTNEVKNPESNSDENLKDPKEEPVDDDDKDKDLKNQSNVRTVNVIGAEGMPGCKWATSALLIVIHNNPYFDPEKDQICKDQCDSLGWEIIKQKKVAGEIISSKYIYCCRVTDDKVRQKLGINYKHDTENGVQYSSAMLSLKAVPLYDPEKKQFQLFDTQDLVVKAYRHIFEGAKFEPEDNILLNALKASYVTKASFLQIQEPAEDEGDGPDDSEIKMEEEKTENPAAEKSDLDDTK